MKAVSGMQAHGGGALRDAVEDFLFYEADLIDTRCFDEWLALFADDVQYRMPLVRNLAARDIGAEYLTGPLDVSWFDEGKETLAARVAQIKTGVHWAEEPLSRTTHFVSNVRVAAVGELPGEPNDVTVRCKFIIYRNRNEDQEDKIYGSREDVLTPNGESWLIRRRTFYIGQSVLLCGNLSFLL